LSVKSTSTNPAKDGLYSSLPKEELFKEARYTDHV
jgi:hypothetical protein